MNPIRSLAVVTLAGLLPTLAACTAPTTDEPVAGNPPGHARCDSQAAGRLVGGQKPGDDEARRVSGAAVVRHIAPGDAVTQDYNEARVTVETDPSTGRVVKASCGWPAAFDRPALVADEVFPVTACKTTDGVRRRPTIFAGGHAQT